LPETTLVETNSCLHHGEDEKRESPKALVPVFGQKDLALILSPDNVCPEILTPEKALFHASRTGHITLVYRILQRGSGGHREFSNTIPQRDLNLDAHHEGSTCLMEAV
jgi:hypothetical protein